MEKDLKNENRGKRNKHSKLKSSLKSKTNKNSETFFSNDGSLERSNIDEEKHLRKNKSRGMGLALKTGPSNTKRGAS